MTELQMSHTDCQLLFKAGQALIEKSGLAHYSGSYFVACDDKLGFDKHWKMEFHQEFGRYMAWVLFLVGTENLAKAACVCNGVRVKPEASLGHYTNPKGPFYFRKLCKKAEVCGSDDELKLIRGYECLGKVRNRDVHSYRKNVRDADFPLVGETFVPALNILVEVMGRSHNFDH